MKHLYAVCLIAWMSLFGVAQSSNQLAAASAQVVVPRLIRFSGQLKDASGTVGITFTLHKGQQDSTSLWVETQNVQLDGTGKYTVLLGATKAAGIPMELFTSGEAQWLGIRVEGKAEQPRVLLVSVPYALKAAEAETLAGHAASDFVTSDNLNTAVQQQMRHQVATTVNMGVKQGLGPSVPTDPATNFVDSNATQVVNVTQNGSGMGMLATAKTGYAIRGNSTGTAIFGYSSGAGNTAVEGTSSSTTGKGVYGFSTASSGINYGVLGSTASPQGIGIYGYNNATTGTPIGILGATLSTSGIAIKGQANATSGGNIGVLATTASPAGTALVAQNSGGGRLISGQSGSGHTEVFYVDGVGNTVAKGEVQATTTDAIAVVATSAASYGVYGASDATDGVRGVSPTRGVHGIASTDGGVGVFGEASGATNTATTGLYGSGATGVTGYSSRTGSYGVYGFGVAGVTGVYGTGAYGVHGVAAGAGNYGVVGDGTTGVYGSGTTGVYGFSSDPGGDALDGYNSSSGDGILVGVGDTANGYAGWFNGTLNVDGFLSKSSGSFKIDHPLDPANKYLYHSFVESPDMMNIYNGNITTNATGDAVVVLPEWFETLNRDFRYQLTVMGQFAQAIVSSQVSHGRFTIKTDKPNVMVSWQVTGIRQDAWAKAHPVPVEEAKPESERGFYLHPELFGAPEEKGMLWARHPARMQQWKAAQEKAAKTASGQKTGQATAGR